MLSKVQITLTVFFAAAVVVKAGEQVSKEWAPIFAETESQVAVQTGRLGNCSPVEVGGDVFIATCNFRGYGTIIIKEFLDPGQSTTTCVIPLRQVLISGDVGGLCPNADYTLSLHKYNCVNCNCKNAGPLMQSEKGIIDTRLSTMSDGTLNFYDIKNVYFSIIPTDKSFNSVLGGSCVLTQNQLAKKKCKNSKLKKKKCKPCPSILCAPIIFHPVIQDQVPCPTPPAQCPCPPPPTPTVEQVSPAL